MRAYEGMYMWERAEFAKAIEDAKNIDELKQALLDVLRHISLNTAEVKDK